MNLHRLIELIKRYDLTEAAESLDDVLQTLVLSLQQDIALTEWDNNYRSRNLVRDADRLMELSETLASIGDRNVEDV